jgi:hypothetical protein
VRDTQGDLYILRNDGAADRWELTYASTPAFTLLRM